MKDFSVYRTARGRMVIFVFAVWALLGGGGSAWAGNNKAMVEVGFTGAPPPGFQNVLLNVQAVRINPHPNAGPGSGHWQRINTPPGIGGGSTKAELQIDLNTSQNVPELFNIGKVRADNYKVAQILLDPNFPGTLVPNCPQSGTPEGCINYPISLTNGQLITAPISMVAPSNGNLAVLILQAQITLNPPFPNAAGGAYSATLTMTQSSTAMGTVTGNIGTGGSSSGGTGKVSKLAITAETIGTNTPIATAQIKNGTYTLVLPAAGGVVTEGVGFGTLYDLAVAGGGNSYSAARLPPLYPTTTINGPTFSVSGQTLGNITGSVMDGCVASLPIVGATLQLLVPPITNPTLDCTMAINAPQCITVASATTDNAGDFPLPGTLSTPPQFENVPAAPKSNLNNAYAMEITAPGYDSQFVQVKPSTGASKNGGGVCAPVGSTSFTKCNILLTTAYISGTIPIIPPPSGQTTTVQVFAEPIGTNNIQSASPLLTNKNGNTKVNFTINVPSTIRVFDLFATTIDQYQGVSDPYQGHSIAVLSPVVMPLPLAACNTGNADFDQTIECVGHGSAIGTANTPNLGASVALEKEDEVSGNEVQITTAQIQNQPPNLSPSSNYAFCAPADTYQLQPIQLPQAAPSETPLIAPSPVPTGDPATVTIMPAATVKGSPSATPTSTSSGVPTPSATPTFKITCPTTCSNPDGSCPGICNTTIQAITIPPLPAPATQTPTPTATATP